MQCKTFAAFIIMQQHLLWRYGKIRHITPHISEYLGPILTYFRGLVGVLVWMIILIFVWRWPNFHMHLCFWSPLGVWVNPPSHFQNPTYGNQLNSKIWVMFANVEWNLKIASAFDNVGRSQIRFQEVQWQ